jgi:hypothetical protein
MLKFVALSTVIVVAVTANPSQLGDRFVGSASGDNVFDSFHVVSGGFNNVRLEEIFRDLPDDLAAVVEHILGIMWSIKYGGDAGSHSMLDQGSGSGDGTADLLDGDSTTKSLADLLRMPGFMTEFIVLSDKLGLQDAALINVFDRLVAASSMQSTTGVPQLGIDTASTVSASLACTFLAAAVALF